MSTVHPNHDGGRTRAGRMYVLVKGFEAGNLTSADWNELNALRISSRDRARPLPDRWRNPAEDRTDRSLHAAAVPLRGRQVDESRVHVADAASVGGGIVAGLALNARFRGGVGIGPVQLQASTWAGVTMAVIGGGAHVLKRRRIARAAFGGAVGFGLATGTGWVRRSGGGP